MNESRTTAELPCPRSSHYTADMTLDDAFHVSSVLWNLCQSIDQGTTLLDVDGEPWPLDAILTLAEQAHRIVLASIDRARHSRGIDVIECFIIPDASGIDQGI